MSQTCKGCTHDRDGRCHALPPAPTPGGSDRERAVWPLHGNAGCGAYQQPQQPETKPKRRVSLNGD